MKKASDIWCTVCSAAFWKKHVSQIVACLLCADSIAWGVSALRRAARNNNVRLLNDMETTYVTGVNLWRYMPNDPLLVDAFWSVSYATRRTHAGREVLRLRKQLEMDDNIAKGLNFESADDLVLVLYTIRNQDEDMKQLVNETDEWRGLEEVEKEYQGAAVRSYLDGNYFLAYSLTQHYFNRYVQRDRFDKEGYNNPMHILRLLTNYRWELTTNRTFARQFDAYVSGHMRDDIRKLTSWAHLEDYTNGVDKLQPLCMYFKALTLYHLDLFEESVQLFRQCAAASDDELLRQYCAFMCVRAAFWQYDGHRTAQNYNAFLSAVNKNKGQITLPYFQSDLTEYSVIAKQIASEQK